MSERPDPKTVYTTRVSGLWNSRHEFHENGERVGLLEVKRNPFGIVTEGVYRPEKGAVLTMDRDPGLRRAQFSMWTEGREWLGSSEREGFLSRVLVLHTGGKPFHLVPLRGFVKGWGLHAPRTGEAARITASLSGRSSHLEVYKRLEFPLLLFAYFLGVQVYREAVWPGPPVHAGSTG
jgi:hypothetical protein